MEIVLYIAIVSSFVVKSSPFLYGFFIIDKLCLNSENDTNGNISENIVLSINPHNSYDMLYFLLCEIIEFLYYS